MNELTFGDIESHHPAMLRYYFRNINPNSAEQGAEGSPIPGPSGTSGTSGNVVPISTVVSSSTSTVLSRSRSSGSPNQS